MNNKEEGMEIFSQEELDQSNLPAQVTSGPPAGVEVQPPGAMMSSEDIKLIVQRRAELMKTALPIALSATERDDWIDFQGKPHCISRGIQAIRLLFGISVRNPRQVKTESVDEKGKYYTWTTYMDFSFGPHGDVLTAIGTSSSRKKFFGVVTKKDKKGKPIKGKDGKNVQIVKPLFDIPEDSIKKHSWTNCFGNGVQELIGIKGMTWKQLNDAGLNLKKGDVTQIEFINGKKGDDKKKTEESGEKKETAAAKKKKEELKKETERKDIILEFVFVHDFLVLEHGYTSEGLCGKYFPIPDAKEGGKQFVPFERLVKVKELKPLKHIMEMVDEMKKDHDMSKFKAWKEAKIKEETDPKEE